MRRPTFAIGLGVAVAFVSAAAACGNDYRTDPAGEVDAAVAADGALDSTSGRGVGTACTSASQCATGQCVDGVCCNTTCTGLCEACNLPGTVGTCSAIPDGQDPASECPTAPFASSDAGLSSASTDGGLVFQLPDSGLPAVSDTPCAGHCDGKRACAFASSTTQCGTAFCGDSAEEGTASCDGAGHCLYGVQECSAYACADGSPGCKTSCAANTDCLAGYYCDPSSHSCLQKLANGTACISVAQCQSAVCDTASHVCCNADCSSTPGGTCSHAGDVGPCVCSACPTGACGLFYPDIDHDGYGDATATAETAGISGIKAVYGCAGGSPPAGYVADNTDCLDSTAPVAGSVHPGQTTYFATSYTSTQGTPSFDYDCDGTIEMGTPAATTCGVCTAGLMAHTGGIPPITCERVTSCSAAGDATGFSCSLTSPCVTDNTPSFTTAVACGVQSELYTCATCPAAGATPAAVPAGKTVQTCH